MTALEQVLLTEARDELTIQLDIDTINIDQLKRVVESLQMIATRAANDTKTKQFEELKDAN